MERLDDDGQWVVMMGFIVAVGFFFLALVVNQATLVGQTTAEGVLEFPKSDIRDVTSEVQYIVHNTTLNHGDTWKDLEKDIEALERARKNAIVQIDDPVPDGKYNRTRIHFNNGVTTYDATTYI
ncbi:hypothetical protein [Methanofollis sp. UBA420]|jgi:hypothetical protein|uniref:hypothetical protein n=1 Tax=Methanofollis sp. UBA420 TaxID=1915514 RepID=UPI00316AC766